MATWKHMIDKVILINLPNRTDRLVSASKELAKQGISFQVWPGIWHSNGAYGILQTLKQIFEQAEKENWGNVLIFEDDVRFIGDINLHLSMSLIELSSHYNFDMLFLGANVFKPFVKTKLQESFRLTEAVALHAVIYSPEGWRKCLAVIREKIHPSVDAVDVLFSRYVLSQGNSYITNPMLATQAEGYSDIERRVVDYKIFLEGSYKKSLNQIK